jgi:Na+-transporting NADH:ubiquinone oxidoreductase subunit NqrC
MSQRSLAALVLVNSVLLAALVVTTFSPQKAHAQFGAQSQFMMIAGNVSGRQDLSGLYIIDRQTTRMIGATYDSRNDNFDVISRGRVIRQDVRQGRGR